MGQILKGVIGEEGVLAEEDLFNGWINQSVNNLNALKQKLVKQIETIMSR